MTRTRNAFHGAEVKKNFINGVTGRGNLGHKKRPPKHGLREKGGNRDPGRSQGPLCRTGGRRKTNWGNRCSERRAGSINPQGATVLGRVNPPPRGGKREGTGNFTREAHGLGWLIFECPTENSLASSRGGGVPLS